MEQHQSISEIVNAETGEARPPLKEWDIEVLERGIEEDFGNFGGRENFVANARVRVTEADGSSWMGFTYLQE